LAQLNQIAVLNDNNTQQIHQRYHMLETANYMTSNIIQTRGTTFSTGSQCQKSSFIMIRWFSLHLLTSCLIA